MLQPMLATLAEASLVDPTLVYEPKYDGIRAIAEVDAGGTQVRLWSRLGNEKTSQFPEIARALSAWARRRREPVVLDGEIVALDEHGEPAGFQQLQGRIHVKDGHVTEAPTALMLFDVLRVGAKDLREQPLTERRAVLEQLLKKGTSPLLRVSTQVAGDGRALYADALAHGWEGLIAKHAASKYRSGKRSPDWRKLKIIQEQEFVVGGWTEPRNARAYFGALLLGVYEGDSLVYVGHTGTGFDGKELARVMARLAPLATRDCPFIRKPKSNERPHWVRPELVAQIKFTEWTADNHLRHPVYLGLRDDKRPTDVVREQAPRHHASVTKRMDVSAAAVAAPPAHRSRRSGGLSRPPSPAARRSATPATTARRDARVSTTDQQALVEQLRALEDARRDGTLTLPGGDTLAVTNLHKVFWPALKLTKGDLFRYYAQVAPAILPVLADRPLVMKRFPNGISAKPFYQHRAQDVPAGVRVEPVASEDERPQLIGGNLKTLLYTCQLAAISQDPWFSRVQAPDTPDHVALDLDPSDDVPFAQVLDVARWIRDELETLGVFALPKTSGASGLHVFIPLAPGTPYDAGLLFAQLVATLIAEKHPKQATVERSVRARGRRVYVDYLQNIQGKTLASAYSARASEYAGVSTPLTWKEVDEGVEREAFTILTIPDRLRTLGDLWAPLINAPGANLRDIAEG
ncbi:MAG: DNA ligase D [Acidobacteria bacterium]|nr:DNA ligase D [Acidobacteriota bacterium]